jgi:signal transduction histidine kinase
MDTFFAPAERTNQSLFADQVESISNNPLMSKMLEVSGGLLVVLNGDRQIVGLNEAFLDSLEIRDPAKVLGLRLGETLQCIHASKLPHGCGTTPHCVTCGAAIAMMAAMTEDRASVQTCALTIEKNGDKLELYLSVRAQPLKIDDSKWILIFAHDITQQNLLSTQENIFFHDINNILTALVCNSDMLAREMPEQRRVQQIQNAAKRLSAEVALQRFLSNQKDDANQLTMSVVSISDIIEEIELIIRNHPISLQRILEHQWPDGNIKFTTDIHLISRILVNMLLNALESTVEGGTIRLNTIATDTEIIWEIWNAAYILSEEQLRIFQKHFSTKATMGRGMGTYSMKLLGEKYLNGEVNFTSYPGEGTTFCFKHPI